MADCKLGEKGCWKDGKCHYSQDCENKVLTNADRIRAMGDEELANIIASTPICEERYMDCLIKRRDCETCLLEWLKHPAE